MIRETIKELYLKEKRTKENLLFFIDLYNKGIITKDVIMLLLPRKDVETVIIGSEIGKGTSKIAKKNFSN